ncbi:hypothetical protein KC323_g201 [Hortaea werneckii]|nr:hypothetical protein KC323_g201 [Hortaea werneckii]
MKLGVRPLWVRKEKRVQPTEIYTVEGGFVCTSRLLEETGRMADSQPEYRDAQLNFMATMGKSKYLGRLDLSGIHQSPKRSKTRETIFEYQDRQLETMAGPGMSGKRLQKELVKSDVRKPLIGKHQQIQGTLPPGISLVSAENLREWTMDLEIFDNPIYPAGEKYRLRFLFSPSYPIEAPEVTFVALQSPERKIPLHPHIYTNGIICLDLLDAQGWSPVHNVESICISIQSMLAGNSKAERPPGDAEFVRSNRSRPRDINFLYHDPNVRVFGNKLANQTEIEILLESSISSSSVAKTDSGKANPPIPLSRAAIINKPSDLLNIQPFLPPILPLPIRLTRRNLDFDPVDPLRETALVHMRPLARVGMELRIALVEPGAIKGDELFVRTAHGQLFGDGSGRFDGVWAKSGRREEGSRSGAGQCWRLAWYLFALNRCLWRCAGLSTALLTRFNDAGAGESRFCERLSVTFGLGPPSLIRGPLGSLTFSFASVSKDWK